MGGWPFLRDFDGAIEIGAEREEHGRAGVGAEVGRVGFGVQGEQGAFVLAEGCGSFLVERGGIAEGDAEGLVGVGLVGLEGLREERGGGEEEKCGGDTFGFAWMRV